MTSWVFKADGAIQCTGVPGMTIDEARAELAEIVGADEIEEACTFARMTVAMCGAPGGRYHACRLTDAGFTRLTTGIVGRNGWEAWPYVEPPCGAEDHGMVALAARGGPEVPFPMSARARTLAIPAGTAEPIEQGDASPAQIAAAVRRLTDATALPVTVRDLLGWELRVIRPGEAVTLEFRTDRVNISVDAEGRIVGIGFN